MDGDAVEDDVDPGTRCVAGPVRSLCNTGANAAGTLAAEDSRRVIAAT